MNNCNLKPILPWNPKSAPKELDSNTYDMSFRSMNETVDYKSNFVDGTKQNTCCRAYGTLLPTNNVDKKHFSINDKIILEIGILKCKLSEIEDVINNMEITLLKDIPGFVHPL